MNISPLVAVVPVVLAVALIIIVVRRNITERKPGEPVDIAGAIPAFVVLMVAVVFIGGMASSISPYTWDEESGELTINQDVGTGSQKWDPLGTDVKSLILNDNVTSVADGAFDTLTGLEYVSISDKVESITASAFGVTLKDYMDQAITAPEAGEYVGTGDGTLYYCDPSIFTFSADRKTISGLTAEASSAIILALPSEYEGTTITAIGTNAFKEKGMTAVYSSPRSEITSVSQYSFQLCTSLESVALPDTVAAISDYVFQGCTSLDSFDMPSSLVSVGRFALRSTAITSLLLPEGFKSLGAQCFRDCGSIENVYLPASVETVGQNAFLSCSGVTSVTFASGFSPTLDSGAFGSWTFYDSDGTTAIDKTVASNLAGATFQGIASALVKVAPGQLALTPDQIQQVHLHDQELQTMLDQIDPLPFQPSLQTQEQEPVSA